jgi:hypothetical protein
MPTLSEAFLPPAWDECEIAIAQRDQSAAQLRAQGWVCTCLTLYRVTDGMPVYVVDASSPNPDIRGERSSRPARVLTPNSRPGLARNRA